MIRFFCSALVLSVLFCCPAFCADENDVLKGIEKRIEDAPNAADAHYTARDYARYDVEIFSKAMRLLSPSELEALEVETARIVQESMSAYEINQAAGFLDIVGADGYSISDDEFKALKEKLLLKGYTMKGVSTDDEIGAYTRDLLNKKADAFELFAVNAGLNGNASFAVDTLQTQLSPSCLQGVLAGELTKCNDRERLIGQLMAGKEAYEHCVKVFIFSVSEKYSKDDLVDLQNVSREFITEGAEPDPRSAGIHSLYAEATQSCNDYARKNIQTKLNSNPTTETE